MADDVAAKKLPKIILDLWFRVQATDLYLAMPLLPSTDWEGSYVGLRISFEARKPLDLLERYQLLRKTANKEASDSGVLEEDYKPWPSSLSEYLTKELNTEYDFKYYVLDSRQFDSDFKQNDGYEPLSFSGETSGGSLLRSLLRVDFLKAQRHLDDPSNTNSVRAEDLSKKLSKFYERNLAKRADDHNVLKALFTSEKGLDEHLSNVFSKTLKNLQTLGYPGNTNPQIKIRSALNPSTVLNQDARVHYVLGSGDEKVELPDSYNGLGFKNLIYMAVELLDLQERWKSEQESRAPLHLIFIEEPEAHLHAQTQQVFIRNVLDLLKIDGEDEDGFATQILITTHSPHILYERGFTPIRYFRRHRTEEEHSTEVVNLCSFRAGENNKDHDFLQRYLKLTHCDLFFADAVVLIEGNVERLLLPAMIQKCAPNLRSAALSILEVGGAFAHRFRALVEYIGINTLVITDLDSVEAVTVSDDDLHEDDEPKSFDVPDKEAPEGVKQKSGKTCLTSHAGALTANQTLIHWIPKKQTVAALLDVQPCQKEEKLKGSTTAMVRIAYQTQTRVEIKETSEMVCGRTLEEAFGLENYDWCQHADQQSVGLRLRPAPTSPNDLAKRLHKRVVGRNFDKTKFALEVLARDSGTKWKVPEYIREGLLWLEQRVSLDVVSNAQVAAASAEFSNTNSAMPSEK